MRLHRMRRNGKLYGRLLAGITLCIVLALIVASSVYYFAFVRIVQKEAFESDVINLRQTSQAVAKTTESAQTVSFQIYRNSTIAKLLYYSDPNSFDIQGAMIDLQNYLATMPFIHSVYVYNPVAGRYYIAARTGQKGVIEADELKDHNIIGILDNYQEYKPFTPIPRMLKDAQSAEQTTGVYTYLCYDAIGFDQQINSAVVVNVSAAWINQELGSESSGSEDRTFVVDDRGSVRFGPSMTSLEQRGAWRI